MVEGNGELPKYEPRAEDYRFRDIYKFTAKHPEAPEEIYGNTLIVGSAGSGKSMVMRQLCRDYTTSTTTFPLYVHAEDWLARVLAETAKPGVALAGPALRRTTIYGNALLGLGVVERILEVLGSEVALDASRIYDDHPQVPSDTRDWLKRKHIELLDLVKDQLEPASSLSRFDSLTNVFDYFGETVSTHADGRRLLLLIDQLDRVSPAYFDILSGAMGRSIKYTLCIATRPSPCAPFRTPLRSRTGSEERVWLGKSWVGKSWYDFLRTAVKDTFGEETAELIAPVIEDVSQLVGPSLREFMNIVRRARSSMRRGEPLATSVSSAVGDEMKSFQSVLSGALTGFEDSSEFRARLAQALDAFAENGTQQWPQSLRIEPALNELLLSERTEERIRVAVREGLLIPKEPDRYGLDDPGLDYEILPLAILKSTANASLQRSRLQFVVDESEFLQWSIPRRRPRSPAGIEQSVFYSHWMSGENDHASKVLGQLRLGLSGIATVTTGKADEGKADERKGAAFIIGHGIRSRISSASVVVSQLDTPRLAIAIELGWVLSIGRRVILALASWDEWAAGTREFRWLKPVEISSNGTQEEIAALVQKIIDRIDDSQADDDRDVFIDDDGTGRGHIGSFRREVTAPLVIGTGEIFEEIYQKTCDEFLNAGLPAATRVDTKDMSSGGLLAKIVSTARRATSVLIVLSGGQVEDFLACVALGAFTYRDSDVVSSPRVTLPRQAVLLDTTGRENYVPRSMLDGLKGMHTASSPDNAVGAFVEFTTEIRSKMAKSKSRGRH